MEIEYLRKFIKAERSRNGITLRDLSSLTGVRYTTIHDIERGNIDGKISTVNLIIKGLGYRLSIEKEVK